MPAYALFSICCVVSEILDGALLLSPACPALVCSQLWRRLLPSVLVLNGHLLQKSVMHVVLFATLRFWQESELACIDFSLPMSMHTSCWNSAECPSYQHFPMFISSLTLLMACRNHP